MKSLELKKRIQRLSKRLSSSSKNCSLALKEILKKLEFDVKALDVMHGLYSNQVSVQEQNFTESVKKQGNSNKRMDSIREKLAELDSKKQQFVADIFGKYGVNIEPKSVRGEGAVIHFKGRVAKYCRDALAKDPQVTFVSSSSSKNGGGNSSRFSHKEWTLLHAEINKAKESLAEAEDLFLREKCQEMAAYSLDLLRISSAIAQIDVAASSATVALNNAHVRPIMVEAPIYNVKQSRHPIVEYTQKELPGGVRRKSFHFSYVTIPQTLSVSLFRSS